MLLIESNRYVTPVKCYFDEVIEFLKIPLVVGFWNNIDKKFFKKIELDYVINTRIECSKNDVDALNNLAFGLRKEKYNNEYYLVQCDKSYQTIIYTYN